MLLLNITRKPYMGSPMAPSHMTLSDLERPKSRLPRFRTLISRKRAQLGPTLVLNINRKPYMGTPMASSDLTLGDLESSNSGHRFRSLRSCKKQSRGHMLLLNINRKAYMESPMTLSHLSHIRVFNISLQKIAICHTNSRCPAVLYNGQPKNTQKNQSGDNDS